MTKGVWNDARPGKRSAAARKGAANRSARLSRLSPEAKAARADRLAMRKFMEGGPPLAAPEQGVAEDRVLRGEQIGGAIACAINALRAREEAA